MQEKALRSGCMQVILHKNEKYFNKQGKECESQCIYLQGKACEFLSYVEQNIVATAFIHNTWKCCNEATTSLISLS